MIPNDRPTLPSPLNDDEAKAAARRSGLYRDAIKSLLGADEFGNVKGFSVFRNGIVAGMCPANRDIGYEEISSNDMVLCLGTPISPKALIAFALENDLHVSSAFAHEVAMLEESGYYEDMERVGFFIGYKGKDFVTVWLGMSNFSARDATLLLNGHNPSKFKDKLPYTGEVGDVHPFDLMLACFEDVAHDGRDRNLRDWLAVANGRNLKAQDLESWMACVRLNMPVATGTTVFSAHELHTALHAPGGSDGFASTSGTETGRSSKKTPQTVAFHETVLRLMTEVWNDWKFNEARDKALTEPTKGQMHEAVFNKLDGIKGKNKKPTLSMVTDAAKPWKKPAHAKVPLSPSVRPKPRHAFKGEK